MLRFIKIPGFFKNTVLPICLIIPAVLVAVIVFALIFTGCTNTGGTVVFIEKDNGSSVSLKINESFRVKLESNPTTGYSWKLSEKTDSSILSFVSSEYKASKTDKEIVGAGGFETFTFKAKSSGNTELILEYLQPWEEGVAPANIYKLTIKVE